MRRFDFFGDHVRTISGARVEPGEVSPCADAHTALAPDCLSGGVVVVVDTGESLPVEDGLVFGRQPAVRGDDAGARKAVALTDPDGLVSREHVAVLPGQSGLMAIDLGSTNGTILARGDQTADLPPNKPVNIRPGDRLLVGSRVISIEGTAT